MTPKKKIKIYLGDLVYETIDTNFTVPLNIAYIAAYVHARFPDSVEIKLFKYPGELENSLRTAPPDVLGVSHYSWNSRLSLAMIEAAKAHHPETVTVMGGPNIRTNPSDLLAFLSAHSALDYYIVHEGEEPFAQLIGKLLQDRPTLPQDVPGCARVENSRLHFLPVGFGEKSKDMVQPSPYLSGWLDGFIDNPKMIPLLETNRGCPFGCTYCAWGVAALSKIRRRPMEDIYAEIDYVSTRSSGQPVWIFCDANFGIFPRDIEIAQKVRSVMDQKGFPASVTLWHSKNTGQRNIDIVKTIGGLQQGYVAIQSTDPSVLRDSGRGTMKLSEFKKVIDHYKNQHLPVATDLLIGLPNETAASHLRTICEAFDLGFDTINIYNIRLLPGTDYETEESRKKYGVKSKFRPIFGSYGVVDGKRVMEIEESVRETNAMTEKELDDFKILHTLIGFAWNSGYLKPVLKYAQTLKINPGILLHGLANTGHPRLKPMFDQMRADSMGEWFNDPESMIRHYEDSANWNSLVSNFMKLYMLFLARLFQDPDTIETIHAELLKILARHVPAGAACDPAILDALTNVTALRICKDLFQDSFARKHQIPGKVASILFNRPDFDELPSVTYEIYRSPEIHSLCHSMLLPRREKDGGLSLHSIVQFLENGGDKAFVNEIRLPLLGNTALRTTVPSGLPDATSSATLPASEYH